MGKGPLLWQPVGIDLFAAGDRAVVLSDKTPEEAGGANVVLAVDLESGRRTLLADLTLVPGVKFTKPTDIRLTAEEDQLLVSDVNEGVVSVDLKTGRRRVAVTASSGWPGAVARVDANEAWVVWGTSFVTLFDPSETAEADHFVWLPQTGVPADVAWLPRTGKLLVLGGGVGPDNGIWLLDTATEQLEIVSGVGRGDGPMFATPERLCADHKGNEAVVVDPGLASVLRVDLATGNRLAIYEQLVRAY